MTKVVGAIGRSTWGRLASEKELLFSCSSHKTAPLIVSWKMEYLSGSTVRNPDVVLWIALYAHMLQRK